MRNIDQRVREPEKNLAERHLKRYQIKMSCCVKSVAFGPDAGGHPSAMAAMGSGNPGTRPMAFLNM